MFRKSEASQQADFFGSFDFNFSSRKGRELNDPNSWWDLFYKYVTCKIDEALFAGLYSESMGRPNAPIRLLVAMMILKEGFGWSDGKLFEECNFNILVMKALGRSGWMMRFFGIFVDWQDWRCRAGSNRCTRFCRPLPNHSATTPSTPLSLVAALGNSSGNPDSPCTSQQNLYPDLLPA